MHTATSLRTLCLATTAALGACSDQPDGDRDVPIFSMTGQVESRLSSPVESPRVALGFLDANDRPTRFQATAVTDSSSQFQLDIFAPPSADVPALIEGTLADPDTGDHPYRISTARIFVVSADSDLEDPENVQILGWDPDHLVFYTETPAPELRLAFGGDFVFGKFDVGYDLAYAKARSPAAYDADLACQLEEDVRFSETEHPSVDSPEWPAVWAEHLRVIAEECHGGSSDHIEPAPDGLATYLTVPIVDDPTTLGVLHPYGFGH